MTGAGLDGQCAQPRRERPPRQTRRGDDQRVCVPQRWTGAGSRSADRTSRTRVSCRHPLAASRNSAVPTKGSAPTATSAGSRRVRGDARTTTSRSTDRTTTLTATAVEARSTAVRDLPRTTASTARPTPSAPEGGRGPVSSTALRLQQRSHRRERATGAATRRCRRHRRRATTRRVSSATGPYGTGDARHSGSMAVRLTRP